MTRELIALDLIDPNPWQPRTSDDPEHISNLAVSIAKDGLLQPPAARQTADGRYQLAFGHSRCKAFGYLCLMAQTDTGWLTAHNIEASASQFEQMPLEIVTLDDEAMYRHAISENVQRKDLSPMEEAAAMKRAMDDFGYDSDRVGALFGRASGTVRGMVRLLALPEAAQGMLNRGEISQGAARAILSMQRIATPDGLAETMQRIKNDLGRTSPDDIIANAINCLRHTVNLYDDRLGGGKARAGHGKYWDLDAKDFPAHLLPVLNKNDLVNTLGITETWQLSTLKNSTGAASFLALLDASAEPNDQKMAAKLSMLIAPPACTACDLYTKIRGSHYCGLKACYDRKVAAWGIAVMRTASETLEIAIYDDSDGPYAVLKSEYNGDVGDHKTLFETRHADLRLIDRAQVNGSHYQSGTYKGVEDNLFLVVLVGQTLRDVKAIEKSQKGEDKVSKKASMAREDLLQAKKAFLMMDASIYFSDVLAGLTYKALVAFERAPYGWPRSLDAQPGPTASDDEKAAYLRRKIALNMLRQYCGGEHTVVELAAKMASLAREWGIDLPATFAEMAQDADREIDERCPRVHGSVE